SGAHTVSAQVTVAPWRRTAKSASGAGSRAGARIAPAGARGRISRRRRIAPYRASGRSCTGHIAATPSPAATPHAATGAAPSTDRAGTRAEAPAVTGTSVRIVASPPRLDDGDDPSPERPSGRTVVRDSLRRGGSGYFGGRTVMPMRLTTRAQVSGHRFLLRRMTGALVRRDARLLHEPMRAQTRAALGGAVLGVLGIAGFAVWGLFSNPAVLGEEPLVLARDSGTLHLRVDDRLHPVTDLASARLILGEPVSPTVVPDTVLDDLDRGPLVGVLGGPGWLPGPYREVHWVWTHVRPVC